MFAARALAAGEVVLEVALPLLLTEDLARVAAAGRLLARAPEADTMFKSAQAVMAACLVSACRRSTWPKVRPR